MTPFAKLMLIVFLISWSSCKDSKRYHDEIPSPVSLEVGDALVEARRFQQMMNETFRDPQTSPLPDRYRKDFEGLEFFEPDSLYRVVARFERTPEAQPFLMPTTTDRQSREVRYGIAYFELGGREYQLELYQSLEPAEAGEEEKELFLPFLDETNGRSTYEGGRYLDLPIPEGDSMVIDFNKAYNPYCAYNKKYSCPIVPRINSMDTEIRAGVKAFRN